MTNIEKIEFLKNIAFKLHKSIYTASVRLGIDAETLNIETHNSEEFIALFPKTVHHEDHIAYSVINSSIAKLIAVNKKLDELNNA
jgi:hypothetical protein